MLRKTEIFFLHSLKHSAQSFSQGFIEIYVYRD